VTTEELCTAWAVQQDLVDLPGGLAELPTDIRYSPDGKHLGEFPDAGAGFVRIEQAYVAHRFLVQRPRSSTTA
jgi:hypothetical protein